MAANYANHPHFDAREEESYNWWWLGLLKGIALVLFGIMVVAWPVNTAAAILWIIGLFAILYGIIGVIQGFVYMARSFGEGLLTIIVGLFGIFLGSLIFKYPSASFQTFMFFTGLWLIITGLVSMFRPARDPGVRGYTIAGGLLSVIVGIMLFSSPLITGVVLFWLMGFYGLIAGAIAIYGAFKIRNIMREENQRFQHQQTQR